MTEASYIESMIRQLSMSHPEISFKLVHNNQNKLATPGNGNLKDVIYHIYRRARGACKGICRIIGLAGIDIVRLKKLTEILLPAVGLDGPEASGHLLGKAVLIPSPGAPYGEEKKRRKQQVNIHW